METGYLKESEVGQQPDQCFSFDHCSQRVKDWIDHAQKGPDVSTMPAKFFTVEVLEETLGHGTQSYSYHHIVRHLNLSLNQHLWS